MKWTKYLNLVQRYPFLANDLNWWCAGQTLKEFVRTKVGFIAFRPFDKLDLSARFFTPNTATERDSSSVQVGHYKLVEYQLRFHVEGEPAGSRVRNVTADVADGSIQAHIDDVTRWFEGCKAFDGKQLVWERLIKRTASGGPHVGLSEMSLEYYLFRPRYRFKPMPVKPQEPLDPAYVAYTTGAPMPPIIPDVQSLGR